MAAICVVATMFGLVVALMANAPLQVIAALALVLTALGLYIRKGMG